jgi:hypothetical protein
MPFMKLLAVAQVLLLARRHVQHLEPAERRRFAELVRRGRGLDAAEREELRRLVYKLEPRAFAVGAADLFSPIPLPRRLGRRRAPR